MVFNDGITFQERQLIFQLRERVKNELPYSELSKSAEDQDLFLVRWVRARENNLDKATDMLLKHLKWRIARNVDNIESVEPHPFIAENFQYKFAGQAKSGHPIVLIPLSEWNFRKAAKSPDGLHHFEVFATGYFEKVLNRIKSAHESRERGHLPITQVIFMSDCKDFPYGQLFNLGAVKSMIKLGCNYEAHYPEILYKAIFVNCPSYFGLAISTIKPILAPKTVAKFSVYSQSSMLQWSKDMVDIVDPAIIPQRYGGTARNIQN